MLRTDFGSPICTFREASRLPRSSRAALAQQQNKQAASPKQRVRPPEPDMQRHEGTINETNYCLPVEEFGKLIGNPNAAVRLICQTKKVLLPRPHVISPTFWISDERRVLICMLDNRHVENQWFDSTKTKDKSLDIRNSRAKLEGVASLSVAPQSIFTNHPTEVNEIQGLWRSCTAGVGLENQRALTDSALHEP